MSGKHKLCWDFRGIEADQIAQHYKVHLDQYADQNKISSFTSDVEQISGMYAIAYCLVDDDVLEKVRGELRPHRVEEAG